MGDMTFVITDEKISTRLPGAYTFWIDPDLRNNFAGGCTSTPLENGGDAILRVYSFEEAVEMMKRFYKPRDPSILFY